MDIRFECPHCTQHIAIDEAGAGLQIDCPGCQAPLTVPAPVEFPPRTVPRARLTRTVEPPPPPPPAAPPPVAPPLLQSGIDAQYRCNNPNCGAVLFDSQLLTQQFGGRTLQVCPKCRMGVSKLSSPMSFWSRVPGAFAFPFKGNGVWIVATSTLFLAVLEVTRKILGFGSFILGTIATGYFGLLFIDIIRTTAQDDKASMELPDFSGFDEIKETAAQLVMSGLLILSPAVICILLSGDNAVAVSSQRWLDPTYWRELALGFTGLGLAYYPMGLLAVAMFDTVSAVNPTVVAPAILKTFLQYLLVLAVLSVMWLLREGSSALLLALPWSWRFACYLPIELYSLYTVLVTARLLGLLYRANASRLGWFE